MPADTSAATVPHTHTPADLLTTVKQMIAEVIAQPELLDLAAAIAMTSQSKSSIYRGIAAGEFPASVATPSGPRWRRRDLLKWIEKLRN